MRATLLACAIVTVAMSVGLGAILVAAFWSLAIGTYWSLLLFVPAIFVVCLVIAVAHWAMAKVEGVS